MRLFVAITFTPQEQKTLFSGVTALKGQAVCGNFTRQENLHLTLHFLGEAEGISRAKRAMQQVSCPAFLLETGELGCFRREGGSLYWLGVNRSPELLSLWSALGKALGQEGFATDTRPYRPHLTSGREIILPETADLLQLQRDMPYLKRWTSSVSLMESSRISGKLTYTERFRVGLTGKECLE